MDRKYKFALGLAMVLVIGAIIGGSLFFQLEGGEPPQPEVSVVSNEVTSTIDSYTLTLEVFFTNDARADIQVKNTSIVFLNENNDIIDSLCIGDIPRESKTSFKFEVTLNEKPEKISLSPEEIQTDRKWALLGVVMKGESEYSPQGIKSGEGDWTRSKNSFEYDTTNLSCD